MFTSSAVSYRRLKNVLNGKRIIIMYGEWSATHRLLYNWPNVTVHALSCPLLPVSPDPVLRVVPGPLLRMACDPVASGPVPITVAELASAVTSPAGAGGVRNPC